MVEIEYKKLKGYDLELNRLGEFRRHTTKRKYKPYLKNKGSRMLCVNAQKDDGKYAALNCSRIYYAAFIGTIPEGYIVIRKYSKYILSKDNLKLVSRRECGKLMGGTAKKAFYIIELDKNGKHLRSWRSARAAAKDLHCSYQTVLNIVNKKTKKPLYKLIKEKKCKEY